MLDSVVRRDSINVPEIHFTRVGRIGHLRAMDTYR